MSYLPELVAGFNFASNHPIVHAIITALLPPVKDSSCTTAILQHFFAFPKLLEICTDTYTNIGKPTTLWESHALYIYVALLHYL